MHRERDPNQPEGNRKTRGQRWLCRRSTLSHEPILVIADREALNLLA
jgi:hypothetical protein